jgi:hypothetical protein
MIFGQKANITVRYFGPVFRIRRIHKLLGLQDPDQSLSVRNWNRILPSTGRKIKKLRILIRVQICNPVSGIRGSGSITKRHNPEQSSFPNEKAIVPYVDPRVHSRYRQKIFCAVLFCENRVTMNNLCTRERRNTIAQIPHQWRQ